MYGYHFVFITHATLALSCATLMVLSKNPIYCVLFLILVACNASGLIFLLNLEVLPIMFIIVYVGAIAVLFLFVIMMLNINYSLTKHTTRLNRVAGIFVALIFVVEFLVTFRMDLLHLNTKFIQQSFLTDYSTNNFVLTISSINLVVDNNLRIIGSCLFNDFLGSFIISGYILLFAMIGAIALTLKKTFIASKQFVYFQVIRDVNESIHSY